MEEDPCEFDVLLAKLVWPASASRKDMELPLTWPLEHVPTNKITAKTSRERLSAILQCDLLTRIAYTLLSEPHAWRIWAWMKREEEAQHVAEQLTLFAYDLDFGGSFKFEQALLASYDKKAREEYVPVFFERYPNHRGQAQKEEGLSPFWRTVRAYMVRRLEKWSSMQPEEAASLYVQEEGLLFPSPTTVEEKRTLYAKAMMLREAATCGVIKAFVEQLVPLPADTADTAPSKSVLAREMLEREKRLGVKNPMSVPYTKLLHQTEAPELLALMPGARKRSALKNPMGVFYAVRMVLTFLYSNRIQVRKGNLMRFTTLQQFMFMWSVCRNGSLQALNFSASDGKEQGPSSTLFQAFTAFEQAVILEQWALQVLFSHFGQEEGSSDTTAPSISMDIKSAEAQQLQRILVYALLCAGDKETRLLYAGLSGEQKSRVDAMFADYPSILSSKHTGMIATLERSLQEAAAHHKIAATGKPERDLHFQACVFLVDPQFPALWYDLAKPLEHAHFEALAGMGLGIVQSPISSSLGASLEELVDLNKEHEQGTIDATVNWIHNGKAAGAQTPVQTPAQAPAPLSLPTQASPFSPAVLSAALKRIKAMGG